MNRRIVEIAATSVFAITLTGCGTLVHGPEQRITIQSQPSGAEVIYDGSVRGVTPTAITLPRRPAESVVLVRRPGYPESELVIKNDVSLWALFGNIATLGLGYFVDAATGSFGAYPRDVYFVELSTPSASGVPADAHVAESAEH